MTLYSDTMHNAQQLMTKRLRRTKQDNIVISDSPPHNKDLGEGGMILAFDSGDLYMYIKVKGVIYRSNAFMKIK